MPKLICTIIDSEDFSLHVLENYLLSFPVIILGNKFSIIKNAIDYCKMNSPDIIICNIEIIEKDTIETLKYLQPSSLIICAGSREVIEKKGFEENIFGYIYKPFSYEKILSMISKANTEYPVGPL